MLPSVFDYLVVLGRSTAVVWRQILHVVLKTSLVYVKKSDSSAESLSPESSELLLVDEQWS